ncbi:hypothetical protein, partial [Pseudomonas viridiflava]|uniref:hypothetical protein n=1 Tax=Pseudomonas viridiflava TaxID=33069 RepID=UPI0019814260
DRRSALARDCVSSVAGFLSVRTYRRIAAQTKRAPTKNRFSSMAYRWFISDTTMGPLRSPSLPS